MSIIVRLKKFGGDFRGTWLHPLKRKWFPVTYQGSPGHLFKGKYEDEDFPLFEHQVKIQTTKDSFEGEGVNRFGTFRLKGAVQVDSEWHILKEYLGSPPELPLNPPEHSDSLKIRILRYVFGDFFEKEEGPLLRGKITLKMLLQCLDLKNEDDSFRWKWFRYLLRDGWERKMKALKGSLSLNLRIAFDDRYFSLEKGILQGDLGITDIMKRVDLKREEDQARWKGFLLRVDSDILPKGERRRALRRAREEMKEPEREMKRQKQEREIQSLRRRVDQGMKSMEKVKESLRENQRISLRPLLERNKIKPKEREQILSYDPVKMFGIIYNQRYGEYSDLFDAFGMEELGFGVKDGMLTIKEIQKVPKVLLEDIRESIKNPPISSSSSFL